MWSGRLRFPGVVLGRLGGVGGVSGAGALGGVCGGGSAGCGSSASVGGVRFGNVRLFGGCCVSGSVAGTKLMVLVVFGPGLVVVVLVTGPGSGRSCPSVCHCQRCWHAPGLALQLLPDESMYGQLCDRPQDPGQVL